ncbi:MAG: hypothetical protein F6K04_07815 [Leptolyngbya sp. SIO4C5]|uniref:hypothetical protein n=1 Tax=Sphaerothrix gracilis TaxID=3151835 RepID=UPI0013C080A6|nr:hypothetical protein [Leptolyngbya sp. SIO4C5]
MTSPKVSKSRTLVAHRPAATATRQQGTARGGRIAGSLLLDIAWILATAAIAYGISSVIALVATLGLGSSVSVTALQGISVFALVASAVVFLLQDILRLFSPRLCLPLEYSTAKANSIYWQRLQISLLAVSFSLILITVGVAFPRMVLVSRLFIAAIFALTILAVRKSIPAAKVGFITSVGIFIATVVTIFVVKATVASEAQSNAAPYPSLPAERLS